MTRVKKYLPFAIALLLGLAFLVFVGVSNESKKAHNIRGVFWGETVEDTANLPGKGTKYDPYRIDSTEALCRFRDNVNRGYSYYGAYVRQTADLDLSGIENWVPIGIFGTENLFEGYYDGAGHTISNLTIHAPGENVGLFGILGGTVVNLGVPSGTIEGNCIGTIASHSGHSGARIVNCYSGAALIGNRMGGMADNFDGAMIYNCLFFGSLSAPVGNGFPVLGGGIAGYAGNVIDCFSTTADICSADFTGVVTDRLGTFYREGTDEIKDPDAIFRVLNDNREPLTVNVLGGQPAYGWSRTEGGISQVRKINWYPVRFLSVALAATALLLALNLWLVTKGREELPAEGEGGKGALLKARFAAGVRELGAVRFWFLFALQAVLLYNVLAVLCGNSASLYALTYDQCTGLFCDFFVPLKTMTSDGVPMREYYARTGDIYPPMAVLFFRFVALFIPEEFRAFDARFERSVPAFVFTLFCVAMLFALYLIWERRANCGKYSRFLCLGLLCAAPLLFAVERGNVLLFCILLCFVFLLYYDSPSRVAREVALLALALAAAIKLSPAVFGLLLLKTRRWQETARCVGYGLALFFVPFFFFGGAAGFTDFIRAVTGFAPGNTAARDNMIHFGNQCSNLLAYFGFPPYIGAKNVRMLQIPGILFLCGFALLTKERRKAVLACAMLMALTPDAGGYYLLSVYLAPLYFFLSEKEQSAWDVLYLIFLSVCVFPLQFLTGLFGIGDATLWQLGGMAQLVLFALMLAQALATGFNRLRQIRADRAAA